MAVAVAEVGDDELLGAGASGASGPSCAHAVSRGQAQGLGGAREHSASFLHLANLTALPAPVTEKAQDVRPSGGSLRGIQFKLPFAGLRFFLSLPGLAGGGAVREHSGRGGRGPVRKPTYSLGGFRSSGLVSKNCSTSSH